MNSEPSPESTPSFVFTGESFRSPLEELRLISEKKIQTHRDLGDDQRVEQLREATEIARDRLAAHLGGKE